MTETVSQLLQEIHALAYEMVRLDSDIRLAARAYQWQEMGELMERRLDVQLRRSDLMRQAWAPRGRHRREW